VIDLVTKEQLEAYEAGRKACWEEPCGSPSCVFCNDEEHARPVLFEPGDVRFVNVYHVQRCYGGPEEGGWYFDAGELQACYALPNAAAAEAKASSLRAGEYSNEGLPGLSSVTSRGEWHVVVSVKPGADYPARIPRYE